MGESRKEMFIRFRKQIKNFNSDHVFKEILRNRRRQGSSTGKALELIGLAMMKPNREISIVDYIPSYYGMNTDRSIIKNNMIPIIKHIIETLELEDLKINMQNLTIEYDLSYWK